MEWIRDQSHSHYHGPHECGSRERRRVFTLHMSVSFGIQKTILDPISASLGNNELIEVKRSLLIRISEFPINMHNFIPI